MDNIIDETMLVKGNASEVMARMISRMVEEVPFIHLVNQKCIEKLADTLGSKLSVEGIKNEVLPLAETLAKDHKEDIRTVVSAILVKVFCNFIQTSLVRFWFLVGIWKWSGYCEGAGREFNRRHAIRKRRCWRGDGWNYRKDMHDFPSGELNAYRVAYEYCSVNSAENREKTASCLEDRWQNCVY